MEPRLYSQQWTIKSTVHLPLETAWCRTFF